MSVRSASRSKSGRRYGVTVLMTTAIRVGVGGNASGSRVTPRADEFAWDPSAIRPAPQRDGVPALRSCVYDQRRCSSSDPSAIRDLRRASLV